ncbi:MAG: ethylbenzene dehydrogenase-related protein [Thermodesulfobacteriota bacterium]
MRMAPTLLLLACAPALAAGEPASVLRARVADRAPLVDGVVDEVWSRAEPIVVRVEPITDDVGARYGGFEPKRRSPPVDVTLRALVHGATFYLLARWPDPTESAVRAPWIWDSASQTYVTGPGNEDRFALLLPMGASRPTDCMVSGVTFVGDLWYWKAARSNPAGYADDQTLRLGLREFRGADVLHGPEGKTSYGKRFNDAGNSCVAERTEPPARFAGDVVPRYVPQEPSGSRGDIRARGVWADGHWTLEMARALDTGDPEGDRALARGDRLEAAVAVFDDVGDYYHSSSALFTLVIE